MLLVGQWSGQPACQTSTTRPEGSMNGTDGWLFRTDVSANFKVTWHKNLAKYQKSGLIKFRYCGQLPAPIVNGRGDSCWKWPDFQLPRVPDLDLGWGHIAYHRASLIDLYLHAKFHWKWRFFLWTDKHMHIGKYVRTFKTGIIKSTLSKSRPKNK